MKYTSQNVTTTPEILKRKLGGELFVPVTIANSAFTSGVCKAGTPINASGAKGTSTDAVGILLYDVYDENPNGSLVKAFAVINTTVAEAHSGVSYDSALKSKLSNLIFE